MTTTVQVGRHTHQLPEVTAAELRVAETKRAASELAVSAAALAEQRNENARLADELHLTKVIGLVQARSERHPANDRAKLETAVLHARTEWAVAGRKGEFDWEHAYRLAEHELGLVAVPPTPKNQTLATMSREAAAQHAKDSAAYAKRLRELGLEMPGQGSPGDHRRPF